MAAGSVQYVIECVPPGQGGKQGMNVTNNPCGTVSGIQQYPKMAQAYVLDPAAQPYIDPIAQPFDYVSAGAIFTFFFSSVVALWFAAKNIGIVVEAVRRF